MSKYIKLFLIASMVIFITACSSVVSPHVFIPAQPPRVISLKSHPQVVLVLGCGGVRGYAHLGILQALKEAHIPVDAIVGASSGSIVAALYADNQSYLRTFHIMMPAGFWDYADFDDFFSEPGGFMKGNHLENFLIQNMHAKTFAQLPMKLIVATTDIQTGKMYPISSGPIAPAILASSAVPGGFKPVHLYGHWLIDGGVTDPVPVDLAKTLHPKIIIAINLSKLPPNKIPQTAYGVYQTSYDIMWQRITAESLNGADVVITPQVGDVNIFDINKKYQMYLAGLKAGRAAIPEIKRLMKQH